MADFDSSIGVHNSLEKCVCANQILTGANWNDNLYAAASSIDASVCLYFYAIIIVGNWMLLNLFIAILIGGFAEQKATQLEENMSRMTRQLYERLGNLDDQTLAEQMHAIFVETDMDRSGVIEKLELAATLESLDCKLTGKELSQLFRKYDEDGSGEIDFPEFLELIRDLVNRY